MNQTAYLRITSGNVHLHVPGVEPWHQRSEREMLNRSRPGPGADEQAIKEKLWEQVSGKSPPPPPAPVSPQMAAAWARFQATRPQPSRREIDLETKLFEQVKASGFKPER